MSYVAFDIPLKGVSLIEASAGTGKTHTIATLFVRLVVERGLDVGQILVVTFTNAATAELRDRVRKRLRDALTAFDLNGAGADADVLELVTRSRNKKRNRARLARALEAVDRASILTIHGFCQRILEDHAFEGGVRFDVELSPDVEPLVSEIVQDFLSRRLVDASRAEVEYLRLRRADLAAFVTVAMIATRIPDAPIVGGDATVDFGEALAAYRNARARAMTEWSKDRDCIRAIVLESTALNRTSYRISTCEQLLDAMDALRVVAEDSIDGWTDGFEKLGATAIRNAVKKNCAPPAHAFFDAFDVLVAARQRLERELSEFLLSLQRDVAERVRTELPARGAELSLLSFDDVIHKVRDAVCGPRGRHLAAAIRRRFPAALIDEFHDTDPAQYEIFQRVHRSPGTSLFLIGDPKQAIYAFRGADIFAYLRAAKDADRRFTLPTNYRSDPALVRAVNTIFSRSKSPFLFEDIRFEPAGTPPDREDSLRRQGSSQSGLDILFVRRSPSPDGKKLLAPSDEAIPALVASEIARALASQMTVPEKNRHGAIRERPVHPGDFAVLTRRNDEARAVQAALRELRIPSVLHGDSSVFDTEEADEMSLVLRALADPTSAPALRTALSTSLLGLDASELFALGEDETAWERWTASFFQWNALWKDQGILAAVRRLTDDLRASARLLRAPGGERRLTNFMHLTELVHRQASERRLGIAGVLAWFDQVRNEDTARGTIAPEAQQVRLERDDYSVQLTTMHRSKGLEYGIVYLPYLFRSSAPFKRDLEYLRYHDAANGDRLVLDLRPPEAKPGPIAQAERESLAEGLRLAYVALTRARHHAVVVWGAFRGFHESALSYLFDSGHPLRAVAGSDAADDSTLVEDLRTLSDASQGAVRVRESSGEAAPTYGAANDETPDMRAREATRRLDSPVRTSSFTALVSATKSDEHAEERTRDDAGLSDGESDVDAEESSPGSRVSLNEFPRGPRAGNALHQILEEIDFRAPAADIEATAARALSAHGFSAELWQETVATALAGVLATPLDARDPTMTLSNIASDKRVSELEFTFNVGESRRGRFVPSLTARGLAKALRAREGAGLPEGYAARVAALGFEPLAGFLRGFIDLVFEHRGRYYVVDYKSNHLGASYEAYRPPALVEPMASHHYFLQYHLYSVALHRHLARRLPGYDPESHFGGAYYLFLRGMSEARGPETGVFFDRPGPEILDAFSDALGKSEEENA